MLAAFREQAAAAAAEATTRLSNVSALQLFPEGETEFSEPALPNLKPTTPAVPEEHVLTSPSEFVLDDEKASPSPAVAEAVSTGIDVQALKELCDQQRRTLKASDERVTHLMQEMNATKLKALKRLRAQEQDIIGLQVSLKASKAREAELQLENARLRDTTTVPQSDTARKPDQSDQQSASPAQSSNRPPLHDARTEATSSGTSNCREAMLVDKVTQQAASIHHERAARMVAERAAIDAEATAASLRSALIEAEEAMEHACAESRSLRKASTISSVALASPLGRSSAVAPTPATSAPIPEAASVQRLQHLKASLQEAEAACAKAQAAERAARAEATQTATRIDELEEKISALRIELNLEVEAKEMAASAARDAKAEVKAVRQRARALLEQQEEEFRRRPRYPATTADFCTPKSTSLQPSGGTIESDHSNIGSECCADGEDTKLVSMTENLGARVERAHKTDAQANSKMKEANGIAKLQTPAQPRNGVNPTLPPTSLISPPPEGELHALHKYATAQARLQTELSKEMSRREALEGELQAVQTELQTLQQRAVLQAEGNNMEYLRHVISKYIEMDGMDESEALFQVIATYLQFKEADVIRLHLARERRKAAMRGGFFRLRS